MTLSEYPALQLRTKLEEMVRLDLLGPAGGPEEEIEERSVRGRYLVGLLAPPNQTMEPDELDDLAVGGTGDGQDGQSDSLIPPTTSMLPSSIGLTFAVAAEAATLRVTARWGHYQRRASDHLKGATGEPKQVWKRRPAGGSADLPLQEGAFGPWYPEPENEGVLVRGRCRRRTGAWIVTLFLVNNQPVPKTNRDEAWLFQPELEVTLPDGQAHFITRPLPSGLSPSASEEDRTMTMLYRRTVEFAVGHGVAVRAEVPPDEWGRALRLTTEVMPASEVERMDPPTEADYPGLAAVVLDMARLADLRDAEFGPALTPLTDVYEAWIAAREAELALPAPDLAPFAASSGALALKGCREALKRIRAGIALLGTNPQAAEAFRFANAAMHQQRVRSLYADQVRQGAEPDLAALDQPGQRSWRPFQLAFLLLNLPALSDPTHTDRDRLADLLWFPTGGGKTEAYLGVAAFAIAIRRLQGQMGDYDGSAGVTVLMRYTLRLLTLQQFQRATALIAACELQRQADPARWGSEPFRIGLWVGQRSTPNTTEQAAEAIKKDRNSEWWSGGVGGSGTPAQLTNCPWCGQPIDPGHNILVESSTTGRGRTLQFCGDPYGTCPFSRKQSPDEGLPVLVVDEEIYRRLPALLIATVDKFAQMPWKGETQMLFGRVTKYCPRHGYRSPEIADQDSHQARGALPACVSRPAGLLRPPDLIIQDELHLISGPLGTLVGLYETAVDHLCTWQWQGKTIRPKVIASTATIRRASEQVHHLFQREVRLFPPSGLSAEDNFFSLRRPSEEAAPARRYLGICAPGVRLKTVLIRTYVALMAAAQQLYEQYGEAADPWMTLVGYFNSMRELGGMRRVADDTVRSRLEKMDRRGLAKRFIHYRDVEELTSRKSAGEIPALLDRLALRFTTESVGQGKGKGGKKGKRPPEEEQPLDMVLATNMVSVGVDVSRLGLMVVAGQPKATAEYIQATSRVGRRFPGLVCTVYNWARPRDLSHYERFDHYHRTFYQQVEALSVTPFAPRALDRGLAGVLVALIRLQGSAFNPNEAADVLSREHPYVKQALEVLETRAAGVAEAVNVGQEVRRWVQTRVDEWLATRDNLTTATLTYQKGEERTVPLLKRPLAQEWGTFTCLNSLRDVEPSVRLILDDYGMDRPVHLTEETP